MIPSRRLVLALAVGLAAAGAWQVGEGATIHAKAWLAQHLLKAAWARTQETQGEKGPVKPWPWADTHPVARLTVRRLGIERMVLAGASGRTLAFGPAHLDGTAAPGTPGHSVMTGHRDTHFRFLQDLRIGDTVHLETADGTGRDYTVRARRVVDVNDARLVMDTETTMLTLATCYPFDAVVPGGPLRYLVTAVAE